MAGVLPGDRWAQVEKLFQEVTELPPGVRERFLEERCAGDPKLREEVLSLIQYDTGAETTFGDALEAAAASVVVDDAPGRRVGPYRIVSEIGRGGMSAVYLGVRADGEFEKRVAIKLIKKGMDTDLVMDRLRQERRILAALEHPSIARLLDGGTTNDGRPWIAMEFVEGLLIHKFCERYALSKKDRCGLILKVCDAVAYAHRNFVIHRDLKPANILVTPEGVPKLLDFGIAKLLDSESGETRAAVRLFTPEYASPEQRRGDRVGITTDVYSIGVVLFELLTGRRPEADARGGGSDLDLILEKALRSDPERRYASAEQLGEDLRRYLAGLPVIARPDTLGYRAAKFVRRNRVGAAAAAAVLAALTGGIAASGWEAHKARLAQEAAVRESARARVERDRAMAAEQIANTERNTAVAERERANSEAATAKAVTDFLRDDLLGQASPNAQAGADLKVRTALDRAAERIENKFAGKPLVEADIRSTIGESYFGLGLYAEAQKQYERAFALRRAKLGDRHRDTLDSMTSIAVLDRVQGKLDEAERLYHTILAAQRVEFGERDRATLLTMSNLAVVYAHQHQYARAEALNRKVLEIQKSVLGPEHLETLQTMNNLGVDYSSEGKFLEAERLYEHILKVRRRVEGPTHPHTIFTANNLAVVYGRRGGNREAAEKLYQDTLREQKRILGAEHPDTLLTMNNLGLLWTGDPAKFAAAEEMLVATAQSRGRVLGPAHRDTLESWMQSGIAQMLEKKWADAEVTLRRAHEAYVEAKLDVWQRYYAEALLGETLVAEKRLGEAEPILLAGYEGLRQREAAIPAVSKPAVGRAAEWLARLYREAGKVELAEEWKVKGNGR